MEKSILCAHGPPVSPKGSSIHLYLNRRPGRMDTKTEPWGGFLAALPGRNLDTCIHFFKEWGIPLHPDKLEGPTTCIVILGIELDTIKLQVRLPKDKFDLIASLLAFWSNKRHCTRKELEFLIGHLQHACKVIPQGWTFLRRMINLLTAFRREDHSIRFNREFHLDLALWLEFFTSWNGQSFLLAPQLAPLPDFQISSDASGTMGYGDIFMSIGSPVRGQYLNSASPLRTRNCFLLL